MATTASCDYGTIYQNGSKRRGVAMVLAMVTAVVLSPLYVNNTSNDGQNEAAHYFLENSRLWNSGFLLPMLLAGLIVAIKTTSSSPSSSASVISYDQDYSSSSSSRLLIRIGSSSWGLVGILGMLLFALYWQHSVQHFFFWR